MNLGFSELLLIGLVILVLFGPKKIPEIAQGLGKGMNEFRKAMREVQEKVEQAVEENKAEKK
ncbi:MAG TPA: twin-arginine translocase TatA/TatE family subunit [Bacteroidota bacterium]|nr:twin-arginine translocase TatA/TatE family subunit [Bacteroidota bacterium]